MRNVFAISAFALIVGLSSPADAQHRGNHYHGGGGNWAAPLVGGLIIGGVVGALAGQPRYYDNRPVVVESYPPRQYCRNEIVARDYYTGRPIFETICRYE